MINTFNISENFKTLKLPIRKFKYAILNIRI
jgi:hypothetical protein